MPSEMELVEKLRRADADYRWIAANDGLLRLEYPDKWVAVKQGQVIGASEDRVRLVKELESRAKDENIELDTVAIAYISRKDRKFLL